MSYGILFHHERKQKQNNTQQRTSARYLPHAILFASFAFGRVVSGHKEIDMEQEKKNGQRKSKQKSRIQSHSSVSLISFGCEYDNNDTSFFIFHL